jgi:hypothetical protein
MQGQIILNAKKRGRKSPPSLMDLFIRQTLRRFLSEVIQNNFFSGIDARLRHGVFVFSKKGYAGFCIPLRGVLLQIVGALCYDDIDGGLSFRLVFHVCLLLKGSGFEQGGHQPDGKAASHGQHGRRSRMERAGH